MLNGELLTRKCAHIIGIKPWKRWQIDAFLKPRYRVLKYAHSAVQALRAQGRLGGDIVVWAAREPEGLMKAANAQGARLIRIEDGFLRSVGLGSNHVGGASLVLDDLGIYFDPRSPSRLEQILQNEAFSPELLNRADRLREQLVASKVSKYNVGKLDGIELGGQGRKRILVPGQVENDASIRFGCQKICSNLSLLRAVREKNPQAWLVYKPHPDTEAGTRPGRLKDAEILGIADQIVRDASPIALFEQIDQLDTMTSLMGFEGLLHNVTVHTWGQPFYAGWGLTHDQAPPARRTRSLSLQELIAGTLIHYCSYVHPQSLRPCEVEEVARALAMNKPAEPELQRSPIRRTLRLCGGLWRSWWSLRS